MLYLILFLRGKSIKKEIIHELMIYLPKEVFQLFPSGLKRKSFRSKRREGLKKRRKKKRISQMGKWVLCRFQLCVFRLTHFECFGSVVKTLRLGSWFSLWKYGRFGRIGTQRNMKIVRNEEWLTLHKAITATTPQLRRYIYIYIYSILAVM